ncbi:iron ABC transporter permease [Oceanotoga sp. DSM 15011]|nr:MULTISPECIES: iron ABC transporter permease [unclassified Oceanotoga]UYP00586.1 iron ABC transporter permease [Oceanotoga sp. DSM 15011]
MSTKIKNERKNSKIFFIIMTFGSFLLFLLIQFSITRGASDISFKDVWTAFFRFDNENMKHLIIIDLRLPRIIASALVGAAFAVSGAIMQGTTRNPLADSGLMGLNAGAAFALSICFAFFPNIGYIYIVFFSFLGAAFGSFLVKGATFFRHGKSSPMRLVLAGVAVSALLSALSQGIALYFNVAQNIMFWTVGGVAGSNWIQLKIITPWILLALILSILLSKSISLLSLGEDVAKSLGLNIKFITILSTLTVLILAGVSVAVVGSVGFVGLIIPHISRYFVGVDYRKIIPSSAVLGALLMVLADLGSRTLNPPFETPIGAIISLIGAPFFLYLANNERRKL